MMHKKVIIIGAGIAGLTAGCYSLMSGFKVEILEKNDIAGGLCAPTKIGKSSIDNQGLLISGVSDKSRYHSIWKELIDFNKLTFLPLDEMISVIDESGKTFPVYTNISKLKEELLKFSAEDSEIISDLIHDLKVLSNIDLPMKYSWKNLSIYFKCKKLIKKYKKPPWQFALKFNNLELRKFFTTAFTVHDQSLFYSLWTLASLEAKKLCLHEGKASEIIELLLHRFLLLGGTITYHSYVKKILINSGKASGVELFSGKKINSDYVVSCADGHETLFKWIEKKYLTIKTKEIYKKIEPYPPVLSFSIQIKGDFNHLPKRFNLAFSDGIIIENKKILNFSINNIPLRHKMTLSGTTLFQIKIPTTWKFWDLLEEDSTHYNEYVDKIIKNCIKAIGLKIPEVPSLITETILETPKTLNRWSGNWQGSYRGFLMKEKKLTVTIPQTLPFLKRFFMAGHWTVIGGGVFESMYSSKEAIRKLCFEARVKFKCS